jgi:hypothetical protein
MKPASTRLGTGLLVWSHGAGGKKADSGRRRVCRFVYVEKSAGWKLCWGSSQPGGDARSGV